MKNYFILFLFAFLSATCFAQPESDPKILIISPYSVTYDKVFAKEILKANRKYNTYRFLNRIIKPKNHGYPKYGITDNDVVFMRSMDFFKEKTSFLADMYFKYFLLNNFQNPLIKLKDTICGGNISTYREIAASQSVQYIINFKNVTVYKEAGVSKVSILVQLYNNTSDSVVLQKEYIGDWNNPGSELACPTGSLQCCFSNALSQGLSDIMTYITANSPFIKKMQLLVYERAMALKKKYTETRLDISLLKNAGVASDSNIDLKDVYQCLIDSNRSKFIAFFVEQPKKVDFTSLRKEGRDNSVNIITDRDIKDTDYLNHVPPTYAYIVKGVKMKGNWFYKKDQVTYFEAKNLDSARLEYYNNLQPWNFFKENSTEANPDFWETNQFEKIKDKKLDPDWAKYGKGMWAHEEKNNRDYIGMYEFVADRLKKEKKEKDEAAIQAISNRMFIPFYENLLKNDSNRVAMYGRRYEKLRFIYPDDKSVIISPIVVTDVRGKSILRYYVVLKASNSIYEWTYFKPKKLKYNQGFYGPHIVEQFAKVTTWNFSYNTLDDKRFWDNYVLLKKGDAYKYLIPVK